MTKGRWRPLYETRGVEEQEAEISKQLMNPEGVLATTKPCTRRTRKTGGSSTKTSKSSRGGQEAVKEREDEEWYDNRIWEIREVGEGARRENVHTRGEVASLSQVVETRNNFLTFACVQVAGELEDRARVLTGWPSAVACVTSRELVNHDSTAPKMQQFHADSDCETVNREDVFVGG